MKKELNKKKPFAFPPEGELEKAIKRFANPNYRRVNKGLKPNATTEDKIKYNLCQVISDYQEESNTSEKELAKKLKINQTKTEYILFCHLDELSLEELITYVDKLNAPLEIKVNFQNGHKENTARAR
jgi:hypothetical protein